MDIKTSVKRGASVALFNQEHILLIKRGKPPRMGQWSLPGGHIERDETPKDAAQRELLEETGIVCQALEFSQLVAITHDKIHYEISLFTAKLSEKPKNVQASDDASDIAWISEKDLEHVNIADDTKALIKSLFHPPLELR